jgi:hypothetical protein
MSSVITLSQVPLEPDAARQLLKDIQSKRVDVHPSQEKEIRERIEHVLAGIYAPSVDGDDLFAEPSIAISAPLKRLSPADLEKVLSAFFSDYCSTAVAVSVGSIQLSFPQHRNNQHKLSLDITIAAEGQD